MSEETWIRLLRLFLQRAPIRMKQGHESDSKPNSIPAIIQSQLCLYLCSLSESNPNLNLKSQSQSQSQNHSYKKIVNNADNENKTNSLSDLSVSGIQEAIDVFESLLLSHSVLSPQNIKFPLDSSYCSSFLKTYMSLLDKMISLKGMHTTHFFWQFGSIILLHERN
jgi:hypothetical protein